MERLKSWHMWTNLKNLFSLKVLIVLGFAIAVIPLFLGVIYAAYGLRETSELARTINSQVFDQTKTIRLVLQKASDIERKARLFLLLSDPSLRQPYERESYDAAHNSFKQTINDLLELHVENKIALLANELLEKENLIYEQLTGSRAKDNVRLPIDEAFQDLRESSATLSNEFEQHVEQTFNELRQLSESLEQDLLIKGAVLLCFSCAFVLALLGVLSRSMGQIHASIHRLSANQLTEAIEVNGPSDLRYLGERLEWLRKHLLALESSKQHLMKNIAREILQPLTAISECAKHITHPLINSQTNIGQQLGNNLDKLKIVSEQLMRYSQTDSDQGVSAKQQIEVKALLDSVIDQLQSNIQTKSIKLKTLSKPTWIMGVSDQIQAMIEQLLANAIQYSPSEGEIRIILRDAGDQMELEIEDDGPGIAPDERAQVFEPFYRGRSAANHKTATHLGLGLTRVKQTVNHHQGTVEIIDSRQDHPGTRIRVMIPLNLED